MKQAWGIILFSAVVYLIVGRQHGTPMVKTASIPKQESIIAGAMSKSLFVPYWTVSGSYDDTYNKFIYFGITATESGINTGEPGYLSVSSFTKNVPKNVTKVLTLRMLGQKSFKILENKDVSKKVISDVVAFAKTHQFSGVLLDLEVSSLPFNSVIENINGFTSSLSKEVKSNDLSFDIALFGDSFYRIRPYDVATLSSYADEVYIMAYDFSKSNGDPGPNFPLNGKDDYGYDFTVMTSDFLRVIPKDKVTVVFGMFGYDWTVDDKQKSTQAAKPLSDNEIEQKFFPTCTLTRCIVKRDQTSKETKITYTDSVGKNHIVWFEDRESSEKKQEFLKSKGINSASFWAHSFF